MKKREEKKNVSLKTRQEKELTNKPILMSHANDSIGDQIFSVNFSLV